MARFGRMPAYMGVGALLAMGASQFASNHKKAYEESIALYDIRWEAPKGWNPIPHSPQSLFLYRDPKTKLLLRGASNQVIADQNPTPDLDSDGLAEYYLDTTHENMADWSGEKLQGDKGNGVDFALIRRKREGKTVITAFGVRGNTTLIVTLSGNGNDQKEIETAESVFRDSLRNISFQPAALAMR